MYITSPDPQTKIIVDYDFTFQGGIIQSYSIDKAAGDTIDLETYPHAIVIDLAEKPSLTDPTLFHAYEQVTLFTSRLLSINKRIREVEQLTQEQKDQFRLTVQEISKTIQ